MKSKRLVVLGEWFFRLTVPAQARPGRVRVTVENVDKRDLPLAQALARVIEVWIASGRRRPA